MLVPSVRVVWCVLVDRAARPGVETHEDRDQRHEDDQVRPPGFVFQDPDSENPNEHRYQTGAYDQYADDHGQANQFLDDPHRTLG